jgi:hypothetical protein
LVPGAGSIKPGVVLVVAIILAGCGGGGGSEQQVVHGDGFRFEAPVDWKVSSQGVASNGRIDLLEVRTYTLLKPYRRALLARAARELDGDVEKIASGLHARVTSRETMRVAGHDARGYRLEYGGKVQEITFVLEGKREYELICRIATREDDAPCRHLVASFRIE